MRRIAVLCFLACIALLNGSAAQDFCQSEGTVSVEDMYLAPLFAPQKPTPAAPNTFGAANPFLINNDQSPYLPGAIVCDFAQSQCAIVGPRMKNNGIEIIGLNTPGLDGAGINAAGGLGIGGGALSADHTVVTAGSLGNGGGGLQSGALHVCTRAENAATSCITLGPSDSTAGAQFATLKHALTPDGNTVAACSHNMGGYKGHCYVWDRPVRASAFQERAILKGANPSDLFGASGVALTANGLTLASCSTNADLGAGTCTICSRQSREVDFDTNTCHDVKPPQGYAMLGTGGVSLDAEGLRLAACGIEASETGACFVYHRDSVNADFKSVDFLKIVPENSEPLWRFGQTGTFLSPNGKIVSACRYNDPAHVATVAQPTKMLDRGICYVFDIDVLGQGGTGVVEGSDYREVLIPEDVVATSPGFGLGGLFVNDDAVFVGCSAAADVCYFGSIECQCDSSYGFRSGTCALCEAGTFSSQVGNNPCELCSVGTYNAQNGATACQSCPNNTTTSSVGANAVDYCKSESESEKELYEKPEFMVPIILGSVALLGGWAFLGMAKFGDEEESPEMSAI